VIKIATAAEQVAMHLMGELHRGRWTGIMPGRDRLAKELGLDGSTVERALQHLEAQGALQSQGSGKRRLITLKAREDVGLRVLVVPYELEDQYSQPMMVELANRLRAKGHRTTFASKSLIGMKHDPVKVAHLMRNSPHEACILVAASRSVLEMAAQAPTPCFALFGHMTGLPIAGTGPWKIPAIEQAIDRLHQNGHQRIVMLAQSETLSVGPNPTHKAFLEKLRQLGLPAGDYNLPRWDSTPDGLLRCLEALFRVTPPTAILIDDWMLHHAIQGFLARRRGTNLRAVACISTDYHPSFKWCRPRISHITWDSSTVSRRVLQWVGNMARGRQDLGQRPAKARFVEGEDLALEG